MRGPLLFCAPGRAHSFEDERPSQTRQGELLAGRQDGKHGRRCGGHMREGERALPGEISSLALATASERRDKLFPVCGSEVNL